MYILRRLKSSLFECWEKKIKLIFLQCLVKSFLEKVSTHEVKGIVSRDFGGLQMILMGRIGVPDVPLKVYSFLNFCFHIVI